MGTQSLGQVRLPNPLGYVACFARSEPPRGGRMGSLAIMALISPGGSAGAIAAAAFGRGAMAGMMDPPIVFVGNDQWHITRHHDGVVLRDDRARALAVTHATIMNHLVIGCGAWPVAVPLTGTRVAPMDWRFAEELDAALTAFGDAVAAVAETLYARSGLVPLIPRSHFQLPESEPTDLRAQSVPSDRRRGRSSGVPCIPRWTPWRNTPTARRSRPRAPRTIPCFDRGCVGPFQCRRRTTGCQARTTRGTRGRARPGCLPTMGRPTATGSSASRTTGNREDASGTVSRNRCWREIRARAEYRRHIEVVRRGGTSAPGSL